MKLSINKIAYNAAIKSSKQEMVKVEVNAKFAVEKKSNYYRAFFVELNLNGIENETDKDTRNLTIVARFEYELDKKKFPSIGVEEIEEDSKYFLECLKRLNDVVENVTTTEDFKNPLNINVAIEDFERNNSNF